MFARDLCCKEMPGVRCRELKSVGISATSDYQHTRLQQITGRSFGKKRCRSANSAAGSRCSCLSNLRHQTNWCSSLSSASWFGIVNASQCDPPATPDSACCQTTTPRHSPGKSRADSPTRKFPPRSTPGCRCGSRPLFRSKPDRRIAICRYSFASCCPSSKA